MGYICETLYLNKALPSRVLCSAAGVPQDQDDTIGSSKPGYMLRGIRVVNQIRPARWMRD